MWISLIRSGMWMIFDTRSFFPRCWQGYFCACECVHARVHVRVCVCACVRVCACACVCVWAISLHNMLGILNISSSDRRAENCFDPNKRFPVYLHDFYWFLTIYSHQRTFQNSFLTIFTVSLHVIILLMH